MNSPSLRQRMDALGAEPDSQRRRLLALGLLTERLRPAGIEPILVGGAAVELYTAGGYATKDLDLALPVCPAVLEAFADLGFSREGRFWYRDDLDLLVEAPAPAGLPGEDSPRTVVEIDGLRVVVIGLEDLVIDRLRAWVHWRSEEDGRWTRRLVVLHSDRLDWDYLRTRTAPVEAEREALETLAREVGSR
jgi:predicted nucleotidyltransferase